MTIVERLKRISKNDAAREVFEDIANIEIIIKDICNIKHGEYTMDDIEDWFYEQTGYTLDEAMSRAEKHIA